MKPWVLPICFASVLFLNGCGGNISNANTSVNERSIAQTNKFIPSPIVLYSIPDDKLKPPIKELIHYETGDVSSAPLLTYQEWEDSGGHQPWRMEPFSVLQVVTTNLVPENISTKENMLYSFKKSGNTAENKDGVIIKLINPKDDSLNNPSHASKLTYKMIVPHLGSYDITVQQPQGSVDFIITKIVFNPNSTN
ncbi:hypothetical protein [Desulfoscipio gibsoniae]|uniref:Uncharacterized protein n=1 Tax=Desulfoscipio gibsoniae DSM 7213 TaxID=767817 RepID=R4KEE6_9FIRM|nr:hypothetical protein [Desulfoscipio gibsoniae]AGL00017.1 hypothetical protein Desgi_0442 [Desulfoscipio gibsoniae DSM 7213]